MEEIHPLSNAHKQVLLSELSLPSISVVPSASPVGWKETIMDLMHHNSVTYVDLIEKMVLKARTMLVGESEEEVERICKDKKECLKFLKLSPGQIDRVGIEPMLRAVERFSFYMFLNMPPTVKVQEGTLIFADEVAVKMLTLMKRVYAPVIRAIQRDCGATGTMAFTNRASQFLGSRKDNFLSWGCRRTFNYLKTYNFEFSQKLLEYLPQVKSHIDWAETALGQIQLIGEMHLQKALALRATALRIRYQATTLKELIKAGEIMQTTEKLLTLLRSPELLVRQIGEEEIFKLTNEVNVYLHKFEDPWGNP